MGLKSVRSSPSSWCRCRHRRRQRLRRHHSHRRSAQRPPAADGPFHPVHAAQRSSRHSSRGSHGSARNGQRLVSRRIRAREAGTDRLRASLRTPDVRRIATRQGRRIRHSPRGGRRHEQRLDRNRSYQLLHRHTVERARSCALPRVRPNGLPARGDVTRARQRPARRRQERAPSELREHARTAWRRSRSTRCSTRKDIHIAGRRLATWRI